MSCKRCIDAIDAAAEVVRELTELEPYVLPSPAHGHPLADRLVELAAGMRRWRFENGLDQELVDVY